MAAEIREQIPGADIALVPSGGGRFEVFRDGVAIFEKSKMGRHPLPAEVLELLTTKKE